MPPTPDDEFTELVDADIPRVDLVDKAANGTVFFLAKSANDGNRGLFGADFVRDLIAKAEPAMQPTAEDYQTLLLAQTYGWTPGDVDKLTAGQRAAALIHAASVRKASADLDATEVLAEPDGKAPGNPDEPGSPAWESVDAASARKWTGLLVRARNALCALADREGLESVTADPDDLGHAMDLKDAAACIDSAVGILARFAVDEQAEADMAGEAAAVGKAVATLDVAALETLEAFGPVVKAGRVLSGSNETAIRDAIAALQRVLAALPAAPTDDGQQVAKTKETSMTEPVTTELTLDGKTVGTGKREIVRYDTSKTKPVAKAKGDAMLVVYNDSGTAIGVCKPDAVMPIADGLATADDAPPAPPVAPGEDAAVIPGTQTVAAPAPTAPEAPMTKSTDAATDGVKKAKTKKDKGKKQDRLVKALAELLIPPAEERAPEAQLAAEVQTLKALVTKMRQLPDDRKSPLLNGAGIPAADGAPAQPTVPDGLDHLRKAIDEAKTPADRDEAHTQFALASLRARFE